MSSLLASVLPAALPSVTMRHSLSLSLSLSLCLSLSLPTAYSAGSLHLKISPLAICRPPSLAVFLCKSSESYSAVFLCLYLSSCRLSLQLPLSTFLPSFFLCLYLSIFLPSFLPAIFLASIYLSSCRLSCLYLSIFLPSLLPLSVSLPSFFATLLSRPASIYLLAVVLRNSSQPAFPSPTSARPAGEGRCEVSVQQVKRRPV